MAAPHPPDIPLVALHRTGRETPRVVAAIETGTLGGGGRYGLECEHFLEHTLCTSRAILTSSCTAALHLAGEALGIGPGDEVIIPSFTFASCASVVASLGARMVFADSRPDTLNIDERSIAGLIGPRTRAVLAVHYAGVSCEMDVLLELTTNAGITLIEDCAHGLFGTYHGRPLGSMGALAALSFDTAKNFTCGEGGALLVNDRRLETAVEIAYQRGTNRAELLRGESAVYEWWGPGGNYALSELQAAFLLAQLEDWPAVQRRRRDIWERYSVCLRDWSLDRRVTLPARLAGSDPAYHIFPVLFPSRHARDRAMRHLSLSGIASAPHYTALHLSPGALTYSARRTSCPCVEDFHVRLLRLPLHAELTDHDVDRVMSALQELDGSFTGTPALHGTNLSDAP